MKNGLKTRVGVLVIVLLLAIAGVVGYVRYQEQKHLSVIMGQRILFYGTECPHCHYVEDFISKYHVQDHYPMVMKEVFHDSTNAHDYIRIAQHCGILETISQDGQTAYKINVPLLWTGEECVNGDLPVIKFFQKQLHLSKGIKNL